MNHFRIQGFTENLLLLLYNLLTAGIWSPCQIKCMQTVKLNVWRTRKKSEPQMGFEPTTLRDTVRCSNHWATGDSRVTKGQFVGLDWNRITRLHSQVMTGTREFLKNKKLFGFRAPLWWGCLDSWLEGILQTRVLGLLSFTVFETSCYGYKDKKAENIFVAPKSRKVSKVLNDEKTLRNKKSTPRFIDTPKATAYWGKL